MPLADFIYPHCGQWTTIRRILTVRMPVTWSSCYCMYSEIQNFLGKLSVNLIFIQFLDPLRLVTWRLAYVSLCEAVWACVSLCEACEAVWVTRRSKSAFLSSEGNSLKLLKFICNLAKFAGVSKCTLLLQLSATNNSEWYSCTYNPCHWPIYSFVVGLCNLVRN